MIRRLPANILTGGNLFCGLLSILLAFDGHPQIAAWLIVFAAVLDALDGKAARLFGGGSAFGLQFDSMADMVSFGVAPSVLVYVTAFADLKLPGLFATFVPALFTGIRLARFNVHADGKAHDYVGLSSPLHACLIATFVVMSYSMWGEIADENVLAGIVLLTSVLMVSRLPLPGLPRFTLREPGYNLVKMLVLLGALILVAINPPHHAFPVLAVVVLIALITGGVRAILNREPEEDEDDLEDESEPATIYRGRR
jgi:CDP-diacylglycerol---serine O-phosphatidyltransferase